MMRISTEAYQYIKEYVKSRYPYEACGILLGEGRTVKEAIGVNNRLKEEDSANHFYADPMELLRAEKEAHQRGLSVTGFFHSHPDAPAVLSEEDEEYMIPNLLYAIVPVTKDEVLKLRAYIKENPEGEAYEIKVGIKEEEKE